MTDLVMIQNKQVVVSSRRIADSFNKMHKHVLAAIKNLISSAEKSAQWFKEHSYKDTSGKSNIEYLMNRNGFMLLVMGFNGKTAINLKVKYISAFDEMEAKLREMQKPKQLPPAQLPLLEQNNEPKYVQPFADAKYMKQLDVAKSYANALLIMADNITQQRTVEEHTGVLKVVEGIATRMDYEFYQLGKIKLIPGPKHE